MQPYRCDAVKVLLFHDAVFPVQTNDGCQKQALVSLSCLAAAPTMLPHVWPVLNTALACVAAFDFELLESSA